VQTIATTEIRRQPHARIALGALAPGSYVVVSHAAADIGKRRYGEHDLLPERADGAADHTAQPCAGEPVLRRLDLVEPGLARVPEWRPAMAIDAKAPAQMWAGVALKPALKPTVKPAL
jgi:hypothetical protein